MTKQKTPGFSIVTAVGYHCIHPKASDPICNLPDSFGNLIQCGLQLETSSLVNEIPVYPLGRPTLCSSKILPYNECKVHALDYKVKILVHHRFRQSAISIIPTPPEPEEPNRNVRCRNPNVKLGDLIRSNCQS